MTRGVAAASASGCSEPTNRTVILSHAVRFVANTARHPVSVTAHKTRRSWRDYCLQPSHRHSSSDTMSHYACLCHANRRIKQRRFVMNDTRPTWFPEQFGPALSGEALIDFQWDDKETRSMNRANVRRPFHVSKLKLVSRDWSMFNIFTVESVQWLARVSKIVEIFYEYIKRVIPSQSCPNTSIVALYNTYNRIHTIFYSRKVNHCSSSFIPLTTISKYEWTILIERYNSNRGHGCLNQHWKR